MNPEDQNSTPETTQASQPPMPEQMQPQPVAPQEQPEMPQTPVESVPLEGEPADGPAPLPEQQPVQWQAVEYLQHTKTPIWYVGFAVVVILLMVAALLLMKSWTFAVLIPVMAVALIVYSHRPVRQLNYVLSSKGLHINDQLHPLGEFKAFGVMQDEALNALILIPVKRFRPGLTVYFPTEVGERIVDTLGAYIPMQPVQLDAFDKIVRKLRI